MLLVADLDLSRKKFFGHSFLAMLTWNAGATWWIWNSTSVGSVAAIAANALLMCLPWWGYVVFKEKFGRRMGYFSFVAFWMCFEYVHLNWQLSWPWLNLGNVFASNADWVQWYEYTGIGGGTLWVMLVNVLVYEWILGGQVKSQKPKVKKSFAVVAILLFPILISYFPIQNFRFIQNEALPGAEQVIIVQPNIDPYSKFEENNFRQQIQTHLQLSEAAIDSNTKLIIWPETALAAGIAIDEIQSHPVYKPVFDFVNRHPNITLLSGIETVRWYGTEKPESKYARKTSSGYYYDSYNAWVSIKANQPLQFYIKSKLVPGVETLPSFLDFMGPVFEKFGGTTGGYAMDTASVVFRNDGNPFITAPIICYESIYGEYVASYVAKGANILTIMTNDGWWGNTPGHKQHLQYARLRAIETRRWIARSANTGISAVIDDYGNITGTRDWNTASTIKYNIPVRTNQTFYVRHGDFIYRAFALMAGILLLWNLVLIAQKRLKRN